MNQYPRQGYPVGRDVLEPLLEKPQKDRSDELPDVETTPSHNGVDFVAFFTLEVVAVHPVV